MAIVGSGARVIARRRPLRQPRRLTAASKRQPILRARRETNLGPGRLAGIVRRARSTIWKVLRRHGLSRRPRGQRQSFRRYEWSRPGALLHMDVKKLARFSVPGHRATGDRTKIPATAASATTTSTASSMTTAASPTSSSTHARPPTPTRARSSAPCAFFAELGCEPPEAVMTDNAFVYTHGRRFGELLAANQIKPHPHPALHAALERQSRTLHPHAPERMGLQPHLAQLTPPRPQPAKLHPLLQPQTPAQLNRRPATNQPRSQRLWAGHLENAGAYSNGPATDGVYARRGRAWKALLHSWLRRHHTKFHGWAEPEAAVVLGRPEQDPQGDILRVRGAEKRIHQGASVLSLGGREGRRSDRLPEPRSRNRPSRDSRSHDRQPRSEPAR